MIRGARSFRLVWFLFFSALAHGIAAEGAYTGWLKLSTPEFVVITPLRQDEAIAWSAEFAQYVAALRSYFKAEDRKLPPLTFVVFAREVDFDGYRPLGADGKTQAMGAFFKRHASWSVAGTGGTRLAKDLRHFIFHEGMHWFMSTATVPNPIWLEEGLAEVFSTFEIKEGKAEWGTSLEDHVRLLRGRGLLPLERLLFTGREELFGQDRSHTGMVYAQSWAFAHYLIFGIHKISPNAIADYGRLSQSGLPAGEAFRQAFGKTYQEMDDELKRYIGSGNYYLNRVPLAPFAAPRVENANRLEVQDALARLALASRRWDLAATHARATIAAGGTDPRGHELLGAVLREQGDRSGATAAFTRATELGSKDSQPYFELAVAEQHEAGGAASLSPAVARRVADRYERAITLNPHLKAAYQNLGGVVGVAEPTSPDDRRLLEQGKKLWPRDAPIEVGLAVLTYRAGDRPAARAQLDRVLSSDDAETAPARDFARRLLAGWDQQEILTEINRKIGAQAFAEALALVDRQLGRELAPPLRARLTELKGHLTESVEGQKIQQALRSAQWAEARRLLTEVLNRESAPDAAKTQARRTLEDFDRRGLGLEPAAK